MKILPIRKVKYAFDRNSNGILNTRPLKEVAENTGIYRARDFIPNLPVFTFSYFAKLKAKVAGYKFTFFK